MSLLFDVGWFDARLDERGLTRMQLAETAGIALSELHDIMVDRRSATASELEAFSALLGADLFEVCLRAGVALRPPPASPAFDASERITSIEARLDAIDAWIGELEQRRRRA